MNRAESILAAISAMSAITGGEYISESGIRLKQKYSDYLRQKDEFVSKAGAKRARKAAKLKKHLTYLTATEYRM